MIFKSKKHILFIITRSDDIGGAQIHVRDLAVWLIKKNYKVTIVVGGSGYYIDHLRELGLKVITCKIMQKEINLFADLISLFKLYFLIKEIAPDLISIHSPKAGFLIRFLRLFKLIPKCIFTAHGWVFSIPNKFKKKLYLFLETLLSSVPEKIITVCQSDLEIAKKYKVSKADNMICIHNGMPDIDNYKEKQINSNQPIRLIMTARFEPQKDHKLLIRSLSKIRKQNWHLTLLGKGELKKDIQNMCKDLQILNKVEFVGWTKNVPDFINQSDIFILTSKWEGFPRSILEAIRAGIPVIASDVGGISESVKNGINGFLVPKSDSYNLKKSLEKLINNPELIEEFGKKSREIYLNNFQFKKMAMNTEKVYIEILSHNKK